MSPAAAGSTLHVTGKAARQPWWRKRIAQVTGVVSTPKVKRLSVYIYFLLLLWREMTCCRRGLQVVVGHLGTHDCTRPRDSVRPSTHPFRLRAAARKAWGAVGRGRRARTRDARPGLFFVWAKQPHLFPGPFTHVALPASVCMRPRVAVPCVSSPFSAGAR
jgi:hypothetical protein